MNIFVAKLSPHTDEDGLREIFGGYGEVRSAKVIMDRDTGRSKCYGFVEMENDEDGRNAIAELDQSQQDGSTIVVKEAEPRNDNRGGGGYNRGNNRGGNNRNFRNNDRNSNRRPNRDSNFDTDRW